MTQPPPKTIIDLRPKDPHPVPDQGARPTCLAMATTGAHDYLAAASGDEQRAAEALWWSATRLQGHANGASLTSVGKALEQTGQPEDSRWPYPDRRLTPTPEDPPVDCGSPPWRTAILSIVNVNGKRFEHELEAQLAAGRPVIVILEVTDAFDVPDAEGVIETPPRTAMSQGNHAVLAVGLCDLDSRGRHLIIRNSWGAEWAVGGHALLPLAYLVTHGVAAAVVLDRR